MSTATSPPPLPPAVLAQRYRLERRLAQGGMAEVWLGTDLSLSRQVAVKVLKPSLAGDPVVAERFRREAIAVARLSHPNIVAVHDAIEDGGRQAVVMQLVNGKSLRQLLDEQKRLSPDLTMHIGSCVASALDAAHRAGLVHRDVKPGNILITPDGRVLLTDFGIAKGLDASGDDLTSDNIMMGTAKYLSPEQVRGKRLDGRADLYSLGLVLYECLAGRVPFLGQNDADTALARLQRDPTDISRLRPTLPYGLAEVVHRLLARRPEQRYPTGAAVRAALAQVSARAHDPTLGDRTPAGGRSGDRTPVEATPVPRGVPPIPRSAPADPARLPATRTVRAPAVRSADRTPPRVGGYQGVPTPGRPVGAAVRAERDRTPTGAAQVQHRPNREFEARRTTSLVVVGALLFVALLVAAVLWGTMDRDQPEDFAPDPVTGGSATETPADATAPAGAPAGIAAVAAFDPDGDGTENDDQAARLLDGDPASSWTTVCYSSQFLGGKRGVGVVASLGAAASGTLTIGVASAPWQLSVYAGAGEAPPTTFEGWGDPIASNAASAPETVTVPVTGDAQHLLVVLRELGPSPTCSADNPFRGAISGIAFEAQA